MTSTCLSRSSSFRYDCFVLLYLGYVICLLICYVCSSTNNCSLFCDTGVLGMCHILSWSYPCTHGPFASMNLGNLLSSFAFQSQSRSEVPTLRTLIRFSACFRCWTTPEAFADSGHFKSAGSCERRSGKKGAEKTSGVAAMIVVSHAGRDDRLLMVRLRQQVPAAIQFSLFKSRVQDQRTL